MSDPTRSADSEMDATERTDAELARAATLEPITDIAGRLGLEPAHLEQRGTHVAKVSMEAVTAAGAVDDGETGSLVLVTGMTPTPKGEGKTVTTIGLGQALSHLGEDAAVAIREPSLGPVFGMKGGAAGGGFSQVLPMEDINLHFTGDIHALTAAHNLLAATLDNHVHQGNDLDIDVRAVSWPRALDMNDRALRNVVLGLGGSAHGVPREGNFQITAASELMAVLCLADSPADLKARISRVVVAYDEDGDAVTAGDLGVAGAVAALLRDALKPNLVQTTEGVPAFVHGGPFANIAHGTNSVVANRVAVANADYLVTEAGFGADLGAEKFVNLVSRHGPDPEAAVVVASVRGLKRHGHDMWPADFDVLDTPDPDAVVRGIDNLVHHVRVLESVGVPAVVSINRFPDDTEAEIDALVDALDDRGIRSAISTVFEDGGEGGADLARQVRELVESGEGDVERVYDLENSVREKIEAVATKVYGAEGVTFVEDATDDIERIERLGLDELPICLSKTPYSLSDDPTKTGVPENWTLSVRSIRPSAGAGFLVALTGDVLTLPGLPKTPAAEEIDLQADGTITGLF